MTYSVPFVHLVGLVLPMNPFREEIRAVIAARERKSGYTMSRMTGMRVGDIRQSFGQMRSIANLTCESMLWCGLTAGQFSQSYILHSAPTTRKKRGETTTIKSTTTKLQQTVQEQSAPEHQMLAQPSSEPPSETSSKPSSEPSILEQDVGGEV